MRPSIGCHSRLWWQGKGVAVYKNDNKPEDDRGRGRENDLFSPTHSLPIILHPPTDVWTTGMVSDNSPSNMLKKAIDKGEASKPSHKFNGAEVLIARGQKEWLLV